MTTEQQINELRQRLDKLEQEDLAAVQTRLLSLGSKFDLSGYLRSTALPQLTGEVTHLAGTEPVTLVIGDATSTQNIRVYDEANNLIGTVPAIRLIGAILTENFGLNAIDVEVQLDRFEFVNPVNGTGIGVAQVDQGDDTLIINVTETGRLIAIGVVVSKYTASNGTADAYVRVTIDGGTAQDFQIVFADRKWGKTTQPWVTVGGVPQSGDTDGHALVLPMNLTYNTSLRVDLITGVLTSFTGEYDLTATVLRGRQV